MLNDTTEWVLVTSAPGVAQHEDEVGLMLVTRRETRCFTHPKVKSAVKAPAICSPLLVSHLHGAALDAAVVAAGGEVCDVLAEAAHFGWGRDRQPAGVTAVRPVESQGQRAALINISVFLLLKSSSKANTAL